MVAITKLIVSEIVFDLVVVVAKKDNFKIIIINYNFELV